jgi:putative RNA 2'-phosphotransferase
MMKNDLISRSKFLSLVLRHDPGKIGLTLDEKGWASVEELLAKCEQAGKRIGREQLLEIVSTNDKSRFTLSPDGMRIRAAQGHSVPVELGLEPVTPPAFLFHGTATRFLDSILAEGLKPQSRQQVHLSADAETATRVGQRHGKPAVLRVDSGRMFEAGHAFFQADNGVWLTDRVPPEFLHHT